MFLSPEEQKKLSKWLIKIFTCCIFIYLSFHHIDKIIKTASLLIGFLKPLLIGGILALIINVPMSSIEKQLLKKRKTSKGFRAISIVLSLILIIGIFTGVAVLILPELIESVKLLTQIINESFDHLAAMGNHNSILMATPLGKHLSALNIDWLALKTQLEIFLKSQVGIFVNRAVNATGSIIRNIVTLFIGTVFAIYIVSGKEKLVRQAHRLIRVWLPPRCGRSIIHICDISNRTFRLFITGQATEAVILGTLCMTGMLLLRIPYAPMISALVGVTALIPIMGAFIGIIVGAVIILTVSPVKAFLFVIFLLILQQIEGNFIYPRVVGSKMNLPTLWVLAAVTVGGNIGGPLGMLLGVPIASTIYSLLREATDYREKNKKR